MFYIAAGVINHTQKKNVLQNSTVSNECCQSAVHDKSMPFVSIQMPSESVKKNHHKNKMDASIILTPKNLRDANLWLQNIIEAEKLFNLPPVTFMDLITNRSK